MTFTITLPNSSATFARGSLSGVSGDPALGFFRLALVVDLHIDGLPKRSDDAGPGWPQLTELIADVHVNGKPLGRFVSPPGALPRSASGQSMQTTARLECDLDRSRLEAMEAARSGGDLPLTANVFARVDDGPMQLNNESYTINRGVWVDVLGSMGYRRTLLVEVRMPDATTDPELAAAVQSLAIAEKHMLLGNDREAVGTCRDVFEEITRALGDTDTIDPELRKVLFENSKSMTKADRLRTLRRALTLVTHPARHRDEVSVQIDWSRIDAAAMVTMTAAFLNELAAPDARPSKS